MWLLLVCVVQGQAVLAAPATRVAAVDENGVMRWQDDQSEVALFGVNYYVPFSIDYRALKARELDHEQAIREDVAHFERLGLTAIRLHCWDREISDREGNLVDNEHLRLLDYLISECKKRGIYSVMTPIAWWGSPEKGGFSDLYTMHEMTTDLKARAAQCTYLAQYVNHVNRYTALAYKDDPAIVAIELINEPVYPKGTTDQQVTEYINALTRAVRETGCEKPIFYNCWLGRIGAAGASTLDGVSFGWYPTGLVAGSMLRDNYLARVDDYASMRDERVARKAKIVYEFDAADVHGSVMYPAMARAFRSGGAQIATQFQYEPMCIADGNPGWQTHYLNLIYTPQKAISFAIAAEVFRRIPRLAQFGRYPESATFGDFRLSYEQDLSELVTEDTFMYSNDTRTAPPAPEKLARVWGCGSSPAVRYEGTGAYFLDRKREGWWELEVYPDAVMVADPYTGERHEKVRVLWADREMAIHLPDLGERFQVAKAGAPVTLPQAKGGRLRVTPGQYVLTSGHREVIVKAHPDFVAPPSSSAPPTVFLDCPGSWREGAKFDVRATVAATGEPTCALHFRPGGATRFTEVPMARKRAYQYEATVGAELMQPGKALYYLSVRDGDRVLTFPGGREGERTESELTPGPPVELLSVQQDSALPSVRYGGPEGKSARASVAPGATEGAFALRIEADGFGPPPSCASTRWEVRHTPDRIVWPTYNVVSFLARGGANTPAVEVSLVQSDGNAFGYNVPLGPAWHEVTVPLRKLGPMWSTKTTKPDLSVLDHITIVFGAWLFKDLREREHVVEIQSVQLRQQPDAWEISVAGKDAPIIIMAPATRSLKTRGRVGVTRLVPGMDADELALRVAVRGFGPEPDCTSFRLPLSEGAGPWREQMAKADHIIVKARAAEPATTRFELVLIENDGAPWGTEIDLTQDWRAIKLPLAELRYFEHWKSGPKGRGGEGDRLRPENLSAVSVCFGAWLLGEDYAKPHAIEIQDVSLAPL